MDILTVLPEGFLEKLQKLVKDDDHVHKHDYYKGCVEHAEEMSWHVYGKKPVRLLQRARPREDPAITTYRLESYEPITKSVCKKALSIVHKIFGADGYSILFDEKNAEAQVLKKYTTEDYPRFNNVVNYLASYATKKMIADPNAIFLVQPYYYTVKGAERVQPIVSCYHSKDVYLINEEYVLLFEKFEEEDKEKKWYFTFVNKTGYYKIFYSEINGRDGTVTVEEFYQYAFTELPVWHLGGEYTEQEGYKEGQDKLLMESYFYGAVPFWNEAINDHSDVVGGYRMHMWPQRWEVLDECEYVEHTDHGNYACTGGRIFDSVEIKRYNCPSCKGSGRKAKSPYETHTISRDKFDGVDSSIAVPGVGYVDVPTDALKMLEEKAERNLEKGLEALSMDIVKEIGLNQSGIAKELDRTELNDFLQKLADVMFEVHLPNIYYFFTILMFGVSTKDPKKLHDIEPKIAKPIDFDVYSSNELTQQFAEAKKANLNPSYLTAKQTEIQNKEFHTHPEMLIVINLELALDPLAEVSTDEVSMKLMNKTITIETAIIHDNIKVFINRALEENPKFAELKPSEQREVLEGFAEEVVTENKTTIDTSAIENQNHSIPLKEEPPIK